MSEYNGIEIADIYVKVNRMYTLQIKKKIICKKSSMETETDDRYGSVSRDL